MIGGYEVLSALEVNQGVVAVGWGDVVGHEECAVDQGASDVG